MMRTQDLNFTEQSFDDMAHIPSARRDGLTDRYRQKLSAVGNRPQSSHSTNTQPDLSNLTPKSQVRQILLNIQQSFLFEELILRAVDTIRKEDSDNVMSVLDQSRDILKDSYEEFKREQEEYRQQLEEISKNKEAALGRRKGKRSN